MLDVATAIQQGSFDQSKIPAEQRAALNEAYNAALDEECRKAGITVVEFSRYCRAGQAAR
jgi:predicted fused transcriptional regulator/phosphomethylpyrimidine kinase